MSEWTKSQTDCLAALWTEGLSASQIGARIGMTRNAVLGRVHRLGLSKRREAHAPRKRVVPSLRRVRAPRQRVRIVAQSEFDFVGPARPADWCPNPVSIVEMSNNHCRWPVGEPNEMKFCGELKHGGYVYCARHCRMAYRPNKRAA